MIESEPLSTGVTVDMTPMIDMVFLLLIFFLVATTFHQSEREMQIALPFSGSSEPISKMLEELVINVDQRGKIIVSGRPMDQEALATLVSQAVERNAEQKVTIRGDRKAAYSSIVTVLDICKASGVGEPYLDTVHAP